MSSNSGKGNTASETTLHQGGMRKTTPSADDKSTRCRGGSVNSETTRGGTAKSPGTLGPREA